MASKIYGLVLGAIAASLVGCSGGGGTSSSSGANTSGLQMPSSLSVVAAPAGGSGSPVASLVRSIVDPLPGSTTDFGQTTQRVYMFDESMESLQTINMILCLLEQTRASDMVNKGSYIALVDVAKCEQGKNQSGGSSGGSASSGSTTYWKFTVISSRADNFSPQIVKIWIPGNASGSSPRDRQNIMIEVTVNEGISDAKPFGRFSLKFTGVDPAPVGGNPATIMLGLLRTVDRQAGDKPEFEFLNLEGDSLWGGTTFGFSGTEASYVVFDDSSGTTGRAHTLTNRSDGGGNNQAEYALAYNNSLVHRIKDSDGKLGPILPVAACLNRDPATFLTQAWRYNLYTTGGSLLKINSGFPFTYNGKYGHVGYWGMWYEGGAATIPHDATIYRQDYANKTSVPHTLKRSGGKLIKRTAESALLPSLVGVEFYMGAQDLTGQTTNWKQYRVVVMNGGAYTYDFVATDEVQWGGSGPTFTVLSSPILVTPETDGQTLRMYSDALGGDATYVHRLPTAPALRTVTFYRQEFITAASATGDFNVNCYSQCLKGGVNATMLAGFTSNSDLYYPVVSNVANPYVYKATFSNGVMVVYDHLDRIVDYSSPTLVTDLNRLNASWGVSTGETVRTTDTTTLGFITNPWDVYSLPVGSTSYRWETGPNDHNQSVVVVGPSGAVVFDKPKQFKYIVDAGDDRNGDFGVGQILMLQYGGEGELWGFPYEQVGERWYSKINLNDGVRLTDASGTVYITKATEMEKRMKPTLDTNACATSGLNASEFLWHYSYALPSESALSPLSFGWADKPTPANSAPAVIGGVLQ